MMQAVTATYDGEKVILDENVNLPMGQKVIVTILDESKEDESLNLSEKEIRELIKNFPSGLGKSKGIEKIEKYLAKLRKDRNINLRDYMGVGEKMFATTEDVDNYVRSLRDDDRI